MAKRTEEQQGRRRDIADASSGYRTEVILYQVTHNAAEAAMNQEFMRRYAHGRDWHVVASFIDTDPAAVVEQRPQWVKNVLPAFERSEASGLLLPLHDHIDVRHSRVEAMRGWLSDRGAFLVETGLPNEVERPPPCPACAPSPASPRTDVPSRPAVS
ncbi:hypothetical protein ABT160_43135 [Streptomyces sp. NPDC001941]|uniref:hypothetical protein n=1 Tax=Streptomyces sp. NPDC001941 TaxID=3154659 RepID=UPI00331C740A